MMLLLMFLLFIWMYLTHEDQTSAFKKKDRKIVKTMEEMSRKADSEGYHEEAQVIRNCLERLYDEDLILED